MASTISEKHFLYTLGRRTMGNSDFNITGNLRVKTTSIAKTYFDQELGHV